MHRRRANCLWTETRTGANVVTVKNGYLTVNLGSVTAFGGGIDWSQQTWLTMRVGGTGTPSWDPEMSPRILLTATPYAMYAANAASLGGFTAGQFIQNQLASPQTGNIYIKSASGTASDPTVQLQQSVGQTGDFLQFRNSGGTLIGKFDSSANLAVGNFVDLAGTGPFLNFGASAAILNTRSAGNTGLVIRGAASQTGDLLQLQDNGGNNVAGFSGTGQLYLGRASGATGSAKFYNSTNGNTVTVQSGTTSSSYSLTLPTALGSTGNCLSDTTGTGVLGFTACATTSGVTTVGAISGTNANGMVISGSTINLTAADGTNGGVVTNTNQIFAGTKTFNGGLTIGANQLVTITSGTGTVTQTYSATSGLSTASTIGLTNTSGTQAGGLSINRSGAGGTSTNGVVLTNSNGTTTNGFNVTATGGTVTNGVALTTNGGTITTGLNVTNTSGTLTTGLAFNGTIGTDINRGTGTLSINGGTGVNLMAGGSTILGITSTGASVTGTVTGTIINATSKYQINGVDGVAITCTGGQLLQNATTVGGLVTGGSCVAPVTGGVTTVGVFSATSIANGASISGNTITFGPADGTNPGMVTSSGTQTFGGAKVFSGAVTANGGLTVQGVGTANIASFKDSSGTSVGGIDQFGNTYLPGSFSSGAIGADVFSGGTTALTIKQNAASATVPVAVLRGGATPTATADLLQLQNSSSQILAGFSNNGQLFLGRATSQAGSMKLFNASNSNTVTIQSGVTSTSYTITLPTAAGTTGQCLAAGTVSGGNVPLQFSACGSGGGVTTVGAISGSDANGMVISGSTINLTAADGTNGGALTAGTQTIGGDKTFSGNITASGTYNTNTFSATQLTFGGASGLVSGTNLSLKASGTGTATLDSVSSGGTVTVGSAATSINVGLGAGSTINIGTATSGTNTINVGTSATATNTLSLGSSNTASSTTLTGAGNSIVLSNVAGVAISGATSITGNLGVSGNISTGGTQRISNAGALSNVTADTGILTSGTLGIARGGTNNTTYTTNGVVYYDGTKMNSTAAGTSGQCLKSNGTGAAPTYGTCGTATTLQDAYDNSGAASPQIQLSSGSGGLKIKDFSTTVGNIMQVQNSAGTATYFAMTNTAITMQDTGGVLGIVLDYTSSAHQIRVYDSTGTNYAGISYTGGEAVFAASSGNTRIGSGNGSIAMLLGTAGSAANVNDVLTFNKVSTLSAAYSLNDFSITRNLVSGANAETGSVLKVESTGTGSNVSSNLLFLNQSNNSANGNLIYGQKNGANVFAVSSAGAISSAAGLTFTNGQSIATTTGNLTLAPGGANSVVVKAGTNSATSFQVQDASAGVKLSVDTTSSGNRVQIGAASNDATGILLGLDWYNQNSDPSGVNGSMYYNTSMAKFRCYQGAWMDCITSLPVSASAASDTSNNSTAASTNASGLSFTLAANTKYHYKFVVVYQSAVTSTGIGFGFSAPTSPTSHQWCALTEGSTTSTANGGSASFCGNGDVVSTSGGVQTINTSYEAVVDGYIQTSVGNGGTLQLKFRTEVNSTSVTVKAGSFGVLTVVQ